MLFSIFIGIAMAGTYILLSPFLFQIFLPKYIDAIKYTQVYALGLLAIPTTAYIGNIFGGQNMLRAIYAHTLTGYIVRISLFLLLGWKWQIWGLIAASIISSFLTAISGIIILKMETRRLRHHPIL
jgi:O-antigen/teichoic acid export membrane protein